MQKQKRRRVRRPKSGLRIIVAQQRRSTRAFGPYDEQFAYLLAVQQWRQIREATRYEET